MMCTNGRALVYNFDFDDLLRNTMRYSEEVSKAPHQLNKLYQEGGIVLEKHHGFDPMVVHNFVPLSSLIGLLHSEKMYTCALLNLLVYFGERLGSDKQMTKIFLFDETTLQRSKIIAKKKKSSNPSTKMIGIISMIYLISTAVITSHALHPNCIVFKNNGKNWNFFHVLVGFLLVLQAWVSTYTSESNKIEWLHMLGSSVYTLVQPLDYCGLTLFAFVSFLMLFKTQI